MKYITYDYYVSRFLGTTIPEEEFDYLATAASTVVALRQTMAARAHRTQRMFKNRFIMFLLSFVIGFENTTARML